MGRLTYKSPVNAISFCRRARRGFYYVNVMTIRDLTRLTAFDLLILPGVGLLTVKDIETNLAKHGFSLKKNK